MGRGSTVRLELGSGGAGAQLAALPNRGADGAGQPAAIIQAVAGLFPGAALRYPTVTQKNQILAKHLARGSREETKSR